MKAAIYGAGGKSAEAWDIMFKRSTEKLPLASREGLRFLNHVITKEWKEWLFDKVTEGVRLDENVSRAGAPEVPSVLMKKSTMQFRK